jgi:hypothetical protein
MGGLLSLEEASIRDIISLHSLEEPLLLSLLKTARLVFFLILGLIHNLSSKFFYLLKLASIAYKERTASNILFLPLKMSFFNVTLLLASLPMSELFYFSALMG